MVYMLNGISVFFEGTLLNYIPDDLYSFLIHECLNTQSNTIFFTSLLLLNYIVDIHSFFLIYEISKYNTKNKLTLNKYKSGWISNENNIVKFTFPPIEKINFIYLLTQFAHYIQNLYIRFIFYLINYLKIYLKLNNEQFENLKKLIFNDSYNDIKDNWINILIDKLVIPDKFSSDSGLRVFIISIIYKFIFFSIKEINLMIKYNTSAYGMFYHLHRDNGPFKLYNCMSLSLIQLYLLSRININIHNFGLTLQAHDNYITIYDSANKIFGINVSHWTTYLMIDECDHETYHNSLNNINKPDIYILNVNEQRTRSMKYSKDCAEMLHRKHGLFINFNDYTKQKHYNNLSSSLKSWKQNMYIFEDAAFNEHVLDRLHHSTNIKLDQHIEHVRKLLILMFTLYQIDHHKYFSSYNGNINAVVKISSLTQKICRLTQINA